MNKNILKLSWRTALALPALCSLLCGTAAVASESNVTLRWALGAWEGEGARPEAITRDTKLEAGTRLKFLVEPTSPSSVYLLLWDTDGAIHVLYRQASQVQDDGEATYIPPGSHYFELDDAAGVDTFFLLSSAEPLSELDQLLDQYESAEQTLKAELSEEIVAEVRRQHKANRDFARAVEKPVMIGGQTRSVDQSLADAIDSLAIAVESDGFYSKTISIDH